MNKNLIDNSTERLSMLYTLKECFKADGIKTVRIATWYWDIPGLAMLTDDIKKILEKEGTQIQLLIGKDPKIYSTQVISPKVKSMKYPEDYIHTDICNLEPKEEFKKANQLQSDYTKYEFTSQWGNKIDIFGIIKKSQ